MRVWTLEYCWISHCCWL